MPASEISLVDSALVASTAGPASAGTVDINAESVSVDGVRVALRRYGDAPEQVLGIGIETSAFAGGSAGDIRITGGSIFLDNGAFNGDDNMLVVENCTWNDSGLGAPWNAWIYRTGRCWNIACAGDADSARCPSKRSWPAGWGRVSVAP